MTELIGARTRQWLETRLQRLSFPPPLPERTLVVDVSVVPLHRDGVVPHQTVEVRAGRIHSVHAVAEQGEDADAVISGAGKFLMPGIADMHVHLNDPLDIALYLSNGVTAVRNMAGMLWHLDLQAAVARGAVAGPRVYSTTPMIDGPDARGNAVWPGSVVLRDPSRATPVVEFLVGHGYREVKVYQQLRPDVLRAVGRAAVDLDVRVSGHCPDSMTFEDAVGLGMSCFEHLQGVATGHLRGGVDPMPSVADARWEHATAVAVTEHLDLAAVARLAEYLAARNIWNCPTLVMTNCRGYDVAQRWGDARLRHVPASTVEAWADLVARRFGEEPLTERERTRLSGALDDRHAEIVSILHQAGAPLLAGTDASNPFVVPGFSLHDELHHLHGAGLRWDDVLRRATRAAAEYLGQAAAWGSIEVGMDADLLLVDRNPLEDPGAIEHALAGVFVNGFYLSADDLRMLQDQRWECLLEEGAATPTRATGRR